MRIIKEDLRGCVNSLGAPDFRYYVIKVPINETGICKQFKTEKEAQEYIESQRTEER